MTGEVFIEKLCFEFNKTFRQGREEALVPVTPFMFKVRCKFEHPAGIMLWMRVKGSVPERAYSHLEMQFSS